MKQGWEIKKLGEVCDILNGYAFKSEKYTSEGVRVLRITNVQKGYVVDDDPKFYPKDEMANLQQYVLKENDLLMSLTGNVGRVGLLQNEMLPAALNQRVACLRIKNEQLYINYLFHFLNSGKFENDAIFSASGIAQKNMSTEWLKKYTIPVPPREEQERIVAELDCLSGVIEKKREQLRELDALAQSIFYQMFGDPITNEKGWEVSTLENVCSSIVRGPFGSALKKEYFVEQSNTTYKVYEQKHAIQKDSSIGTYYISADMFETLSRFEIKEGDIIMSCSGTIGEFYEIPIGAEKGIMNQALLKYTLNKNIHKIYFLYVMERVKENFEKKGSGLQNIGSVKTIKSTDISLPPLTLQQEFADKIALIEKQQELIKKSIAQTEELFNSRMSYYFN